MRARTIREGSVGLLVLAGVALFGGLVIWLRGVSYGQRSYRLLVDFESANGILEGSAVSYRGVQVGQITRMTPSSNTVVVEIQINKSDLRIPAESVIKTSQSGLIGETTIAIQPPADVSVNDDSLPEPIARDCDSSVILCNGDRVNGLVGVNYEDLLESSQEISEALADPELLADAREILDNTRQISGNVVGLTDEVTLMAQSLRNEVQPLSVSARQTLASVSEAASQLEATTVRTSEQLDVTLTQVNTILASNQDDLAITLDNISASTGQLRLALDTLSPVIQDGTLVNNIELLATNAAVASQDLRDISSRLNTSENLVLLQQTIESARDVFQSAQKIMADVDTLTGDPTLRSNVRDLLNSLSNLVSYTGDLEDQTEVAAQLNHQGQIVTDLEHSLEEEASILDAPTETTEPAMDEAVPVLRYNGERYVTDLADSATLAPDNDPTKNDPTKNE
ncbi:ABC-type transport system involved in resistance to organic solvents, periplasmic component [Leptolyngbya sp. PCC 7375]|nr:ABC-type transport system involved in resistance to organic solvents, periplasmic component [Leptolyngbya sp. PCC 7375]